MAGNTDFLVFYQELGLRADCSLQDFKLAYRKRVSEIHPDRDPENATTVHGLQRLNGLYANAMEFYRRHGRLPGAVPVAAVLQRAPSGMPAEVALVPAESAKTRQWIFAALMLLLVAMALWAWAGAGREEASRAEVPAQATGAVAPADAPAEIAMDLGTPAEQVRALNGEPVSGWEQRWEYGPSWVAFRCGLVSDWYSSRLRPLKVTTERPSPSAEWSPPKSCRE